MSKFCSDDDRLYQTQRQILWAHHLQVFELEVASAST
jgi:hypothetical protein